MVAGVLYAVRGPAPVPRARDQVVIDVRVDTDGTTRVLVAPWSGERDDVREAAREIAESITGRVARRVETDMSDGRPYAEVFLGRMFEPGEAPRVALCGAVAIARVVTMPLLRAWPDDELGVSGAIGGPALTVAGYAGLPWLLTALLGPWLLLAPRRRATITP